ncbi:MAG TPA: hypothetical protein VML00_07165 [Bacteroidota bacterium]|nr:hypothetical protein [Bacteroidota bacterium]
MKRAIYSTIAFFVCILVIVLVVSLRHPLHPVKYEDGRVVPAAAE